MEHVELTLRDCKRVHCALNLSSRSNHWIFDAEIKPSYDCGTGKSQTSKIFWLNALFALAISAIWFFIQPSCNCFCEIIFLSLKHYWSIKNRMKFSGMIFQLLLLKIFITSPLISLILPQNTEILRYISFASKFKKSTPLWE